jgi:hypothetical protein
MEATTRELGLTFHVRLEVLEVDAERHRVTFDVSLPFGLKNHSSIKLTPLGADSTRIQYG